MQDMLGREFDIEQDENGNEVWLSTEHPEFTFKSIEKYKDEDGDCLLYPDKFGSSTIKYDEANDIIKGKEPDVAEYPTELVDIMPVTNQMFVPLVNNQVILNSQRSDYTAVCNAGPTRGRKAIKIMFGIYSHCYANIAPGTLNSPAGTSYGETSDLKNILYRNIKRRLSTIDSPLEQIKTVASMLNANQELSDAIPHKQFDEIMTDFAKNASLALEEHPEQAYQIFNAFNSIIQSDWYKETKSFSTDFYVALAKNAPQVFINNASLIPPFQRMGRLPSIAKEHNELALRAFDAMPSLVSYKYSDQQYKPAAFKEEACVAFRTFLDMQLPDDDKEKMFTILFNDKITTSELIKYADGFSGVKPSLDKYIENHNTYSDEFCEALMHLASSGNDAHVMAPYIDDMIKKQKTLSVEFCKDMGEYTRHEKNYTGEYLHALKKLPAGVDKTEHYKNLVYIVTNANAYSRLEREDKEAAINYVAQSPEKLSPEFCDYLIETGKDMSDWKKNELQPIFLRVLHEDISYYYKHKNVFGDDIFVQNVAITDHSLIPEIKNISKENFDAFAKIYEEYASRDDNFENFVGQKNVMLDKGKTAKIMDTIKDKISKDDYYSHKPSKLVQVWLVKNAKKYPNLVGDILKTKELPYVEMCIKHIEDPEKENIASLLNRLEAKEKMQYIGFYENRSEDNEQKFDSKKYQESLTYEDFQDARDFVARRDMCMRVTGGYKELSYDMAEAGIDDFKTAKRVDQLFAALNGRPDIYNSDYNNYYPKDLLPIAKFDKLQDWMYPVMINAIQKGGLTVSEERLPSEKTLFDCCKAWKICPEMPQKLAKFVGAHSLKGRMLAGAIFDKMCEEGNTTPQEWRENKELHQKFYEELDRAQKMPREKALKQYIPNTPVNRKHLVGMAMEEKGIENTRENFKSLYRQMREKGVFDKLLASPKEAKTTFSSRLLVESARRKHGRK